MKQFIIHLLIISLCVVLVFTLLIGLIVCGAPNVYDSTYQSVMQRKYDALIQTNEPKIIIIGGSSAGFGIDEEMIEEATGYPVVNLGLHAGFGGVVPLELSKANINSNDIILLAFEWDWFISGYFDTLGTSLVMSAFEDRLDMYSHIPARFYPRFIGYLFEYAQKKSTATEKSGVYSSQAFDSKGRMVYERPKPIFKYEGNESTYGSVNVSNAVIAKDTAEYLIKYREYAEKQGASVYFVSPPYLDEASTKCTAEDFRTLAKKATDELKIPYISDPAEYCFPMELMYDTIYHCNDIGETKRTELLIHDLLNVGIHN